jgi:AcrR family transcriptional regulator
MTTGVELETRERILAAAKEALLEIGFAQLSTRKIAEIAGVPLSQIHYHFGSKQRLLLDVLDEENKKLLQRQAVMYGSEMPLWKQWEQACDFLEDDLRSGYVRVLHEMAAAGWSDGEIAIAVRDDLRGWFDLLMIVAEQAATRLGGLGPFMPREAATLVGLPFLGAETAILLGMEEAVAPARSALRKVGEIIRSLEEAG